MSTIDERAAMLLRHEREFAESLAARVIEKPKVSVWMILIPILIVYHMYRHSQYVAGRKQFVEHYLMSRTKAINEAVAVYSEGREPDAARIAEMNGLPSDLHPLLEELLRELVQHYLALIRADGEELDALIRAAYGSGTAYLLVMNRLNTAERRLYDALSSKLQAQQEGVNNIVLAMEAQSEHLRRMEAERIFG